MKVLLFCTANLDLGSGSEVRARLIAQGLKKNGAQVFVVASGAPKSFKKMGIDFLSIQDKPWPRVIKEGIKTFQPEIIYCVTEAGLSDVLAVAKAHRIKTACDLHGLGIIEVIELGRKYGPRWPRIKQSFLWLKTIPRFDMITVANPTLLWIIKLFNRKTYPIIGMTDLAQFSPRGKKAVLGRRDKIQVLYAGNFFKWQGVDLLLGAINVILKQTSDFEFTLLGSVGKDKTDISQQKKFHNPNIHFVQSVPFKKVADFYRGADILVIPRPWMLSTYLAFPQKLVDYMASGKPIVATAIRPHGWALLNPVSGVITAANERGIARGILSLKSKKMRDKLGANAYQKAQKQFSYLLQSKKIKELFKKLGS